MLGRNRNRMLMVQEMLIQSPSRSLSRKKIAAKDWIENFTLDDEEETKTLDEKKKPVDENKKSVVAVFGNEDEDEDMTFQHLGMLPFDTEV